MEKLLPEVCDIQYGFPFDSSKFSVLEGMPIIRIRDVLRGYSETFTTQEFDENYIVKDRDILIGMDGEFNIAKWGKQPALLNQRVCRLFPKDNIDADYLFYFLQGTLKKIEDRTAFATVKHLSAKELNKIAIPFPPVEEQKRIGKALNKTNELISCRKEQLSKLDELVKARFVEMFGDPNLNSKGWIMGVINDIGTCIAGATPSTKVKEYWENGNIPWMSSGEVNKGRVFTTDTKITQLGYNNASTKLVPPKTVVLAMAGQGKTRGTAAITEIELCTNQSICSIVNNEKINAEYLLHFLKMQYKELRGASTNTEGRGGLNLKIIGNYPIMIPPIDLQNQFADFVEQTEKTKAEVQKSLDELETLKKSLMQKYFG